MTAEQWFEHVEFLLLVHSVENFTPQEICNLGHEHKGSILVAPEPELLVNAVTLVDGPLSWIRGYQGDESVTVNSWFRSTAYNKAVGGTARSMHLTCGASDITKAGWTPAEVAMALHFDYSGAGALGIGLYKTFVHVDIRGLIGRRSPARWAGAGVDKVWWRLSD